MPVPVPYYPAAPAPAEEAEILRQEAQALRQSLDAMQRRLEELEAEKQSPEE